MTNPPVPATPLDVEACVRLLRMFAEKYERDAAYYERTAERWAHPDVRLRYAREATEVAALVDALASALPGMGKDSERLDTLERFGWVKAGWGLVPQFEWTRKADDGPGGWARLVSPRLRDAIDAARAAQPEETSADASQDCYACGHARVQHLNESNELDDCLDCHCSEFMQSPASSPSPERPE